MEATMALFNNNTIVPIGWTAQTSTASAPLNSAARIKNPVNNQLSNQPGWYNNLVNLGARQFAAGGGQDPAGLLDPKQYFRNFYSGYDGSVPIQQGLLDYAAANLSHGNFFQKGGIKPNDAFGFARSRIGDYANAGMWGANPKSVGKLFGGNRGFF